MDTCVKFSDFKIFQNDDRKYMYCVEDNKVFEIDDKTIALLNEDGKTYKEIEEDLDDVFTRDELKELLQSMHEFGIIENENEVEDDKDEFYNISTIILLVAQDCNLRCSYCYADEGKYHDCGRMSVETAKRAVDFLIEKSKEEKIGICFFGGEPLLNFKLIKEVVSYCREREKEVNKTFGFSMTTNGTLLNDEIKEYIKENKIGVQISIDGDKETHDTNRYFAGKVGSFDTVFEKTKSLRDENLLAARGTVTSKQFDLLHTYDFLKSMGFSRVVLSPAFNLLKDEDYDKLADEYIKLYRDFEKRLKDKKYDEVKNNHLVMEALFHIHNSQKRKTACGAGKNMYAIDINGDIYPCQRFVGVKQAFLGNVFEDDYNQEEFANKTKVNNFSKCDKCWIRNICVGGCVHTNLSLTEDMNEPYEKFCEFKRKIVTEAVNIYLRLSDEEIDVLFKGTNEISCNS